MNYILKYSKINELLKNKLNLKFYVKRILRSIHKITPLNDGKFKYEEDINIIHRSEPLYQKLFLNWIPKDKGDKVIKILKSWQNKLLKQNIFMSFGYIQKQGMNIIDLPDAKDSMDFNLVPDGNFYYEYSIYFKDIHTRRIKPLNIVYHYSDPKNRESILKNGIIPNPSIYSNKWFNFPDLAYPPAIFALNEMSLERGWHHHGEKSDIWAIDTTKLKNIWWEDLNFTKRKDMIMTFEAIPVEYITLKNNI